MNCSVYTIRERARRCVSEIANPYLDKIYRNACFERIHKDDYFSYRDIRIVWFAGLCWFLLHITYHTLACTAHYSSMNLMTHAKPNCSIMSCVCECLCALWALLRSYHILCIILILSRSEIRVYEHNNRHGWGQSRLAEFG